MKRAACLLAAALLTLALALPAFAETASEPTTLEPITPREFVPIVPYDDETWEEETTLPETTTQPPIEYTTIGIVPISGGLEDAGLGLPQEIGLDDILKVGTLGISLLALLLAVIALARTAKKKPGNAAGNYKKYF